MRPYTRKASALWLGSGQGGKGAISTPSAVPKKTPYTSGNDVKRRGTSPAELLAAAHAGSFSMTLARELGEAGYRPRQIDTTAAVTMEDNAAGWMLTQIHLDVVATVPKVVECDFVDAALRAQGKLPRFPRAQPQHLDARQIEPERLNADLGKAALEKSLNPNVLVNLVSRERKGRLKAPSRLEINPAVKCRTGRGGRLYR